MRHSFISINWGGRALGAEQQLVMMKVAALYLHSDRKRNSIEFTHELIDGRLIYQSQGVFVAFAGHFFRVELGEIDGKPWYHEFLFLNGAENELLEDDRIFVRTTYSASGLSFDVADPEMTRVTNASLLG